MSGTTTTTQPGVVAFDYSAWSARYVALAGVVTEATAAPCFEEAGLYLNNTPRSPVQDLTRRGLLLGMLTAHIAQLSLPETAGGNGAGTVGRVASAGEGSTSVSLDMGAQPGSAAWFMQTQYGASFWQATAYLRQMRFVPGRSPRPGIWP